METKFNLKLPKKNQLVILLLIGILLVVIAIPTEREENEKTKTAEQTGNDTGEMYERTVETRLERILREVEGVGKVKVMVTFQTSTEKVVEKDIEENRETTVYNNASGGEQTPYVSKEINPRIEGVVVIAEGGENAVTVKNITEAVQALFDVDTHKIKVMKRNQTN